MPAIICVKLAQRILPEREKRSHPFTYFPFDRCYLVPPEAQEQLPKLFRVYMRMDFTAPLHAALNDVSFERVHRDTLYRNFSSPEPGKPYRILHGLCDDPTGWELVVPTFMWNEYNAVKKAYTNSTIRYVLSRVIGPDHNINGELPRIMLVTPEQTFPLMCVACLRLPEQLSGRCTIGTANCRKTCSFKLPVDPLHLDAHRVKKEEPPNDRI
jgi:hypothetical protein